MDITECLPEGTAEADIRIEVLGHRRNSHGPLHHAKKWPTWTGPAEFVTEGADWTDELPARALRADEAADRADAEARQGRRRSELTGTPSDRPHRRPPTP